MKPSRPIDKLPVGKYYYCTYCEAWHGAQKPADDFICGCGRPWRDHKGMVVRGRFTRKAKPEEETLVFVADAGTVPVVIYLD